MAKGKKTGGRTAGTPNKVQREDRKLAAKYGPGAIEGLAVMAGLAKPKATSALKIAESEQARVGALKEILDRAYGKPAQAIDGDGEGGPIHVVNEIILRGVRSQPHD